MTVLLRARLVAFFAFAAFERAFAAAANLRRAASCFADGALLLRRFLLAAFRAVRFVVVFFIAYENPPQGDQLNQIELILHSLLSGLS